MGTQGPHWWKDGPRTAAVPQTEEPGPGEGPDARALMRGP